MHFGIRSESRAKMKILPLGWFGLALCAALIFRALTLPEVFTRSPGGELEIFLHRADSSYHARRALYTAENFPDVLVRDSYLAYPDGALVPMPPFYDWALGAVAHALGGGERRFEWVAALASPLLGALSLVAVVALALPLGGAGVAALAALIAAALPVTVQWQRFGDADHHAAVAFLGTSYLALAAHVAQRDRTPRDLALLSGGLALARVAIATAWSGSLLYLGSVEAALALALLASPGAQRYSANAASLTASAALLSLVVAACPTPAGGPFSATTLSWLHVSALAAAAIAMGLLGAAEALRPARSAISRALRTAIAAIAVAAIALLAVPGLWDGIRPGASFIAGDDTWASRNPEQMPLVGFIRVPGIERPMFGIGHGLYGGYLYLIPLVPVVLFAAARDPARRGAALCSGVFASVLAPLAVLQLRFGNEFAPVASIGFALCIDFVRRRLAAQLGARSARIACAAGALLLWLPGAAINLLDPARAALAYLGAAGFSAPHKAHDVAGFPLLRFAERVRELTPETSGYFDPSARPEYSVLCYPGHGSVMTYYARRPVASNSFGPYLDFEKYRLARSFFEVIRSESEAIEIVDRLESRYVMSFDYSRMLPSTFAYQLHRLDGSARGGSPALQHFRLLAESEPGDLPLWHDFPDGSPGYRVIPYKLFEIVAGAELEVHTQPGALVTARVGLRVPSGRDFVYRQTATANAQGSARLVLPYPTASDDARIVRSDGDYQIEVGNATQRVAIPESAVERGETISIPLPVAAKS
jgi:dolichyl-diphosphooligosaccharide--protein glycosyltransferase